MTNLKPIFDPLCKKIVREPPCRQWGVRW